jgi:hypothetical protein
MCDLAGTILIEPEKSMTERAAPAMRVPGIDGRALT